jgi:23S rRNA (cytidine1920-2'-O)/16S rRNA (cytidine1409-2'-O)-methyltransferase
MRLDKYLVEQKYFSSRARAKEAIERGEVLIDACPVTSPDAEVGETVSIEVRSVFPWVSRGALKLISALDEWKIDPSGLPALDLGASTGGFTEVLLSRGATKVYAVDVGHGQLHPKLLSDPRVVNMEGVDVRQLSPQQFPYLFSLIVGDLSFISLSKVLPMIQALLANNGKAILLVKPQFEVGFGGTKKGIVREREKRESALRAILDEVRSLGFSVGGSYQSPVVGGSGNIEYLILIGH